MWAQRWLNRAADHISRGSSRKATGCEGSAARQARAASDSRARWLITSTTADVAPVVGAGAGRRAAAPPCAPKCVSATHSIGRHRSCSPLRPMVPAVMTPAAQLPRMIAVIQRKKSAQDRSSGRLTSKPVSHQSTITASTTLATMKPTEKTTPRPATSPAASITMATRTSSQRVCRRGAETSRPVGERGGRPPPRHERRVGSLTQGVDRRRRARTQQDQRSARQLL